MAERKRVVNEVKRVFGGRLDQIERRLARVERASYEELRAGAADDTSEIPPAMTPDRAPEGLDRALTETRRALVVAGTEGLRKIQAGREDEITEAEQIGLEAIVVLEGRPALFIQNDDIVNVPPDWLFLNDQRPQLQSSITRVGRIEVSGHPDFDWLGTGFLVGPDVIMTNRHVADVFAMASDGGWAFRTGMGSNVDFKEEHGSLSPLEFRIAEIIGIHDQVDLALLRCETSSAAGTSLPEPLQISAQALDPLEERGVYVIGYPAWDGRRNDPQYMQQIFMDIYNVKRLQPGEIRSFQADVRDLVHDCSTLGGNSGSPLFDLESHRVVGLHFGGRYLEGNHAVPLWLLQEDELLTRAGVNFVEGETG
jgi:hypothetical protein